MTVPAFAFDAHDADAAFTAFNTNFYVVSHDLGHYKKNTDGGRSDFWTQAEQIEMIIDAYERTGDAPTKQMITESINGFTHHFGQDWTRNKFNDDLIWMTIACARGYLVTSNTAFRKLAKHHFDAVYQRAWSSSLDGGLWWTTDNTSKNACINGPAALAACFLSDICADKSYLTKAQAIYAWERMRLFNPNTGAVYDNIHTNGNIGRYVFTYNTGTFIGAANYLYKLTGETNYLNDAFRAADFTRNQLAHGGTLPAYGSGDVAGFNGIFLRWMVRFVNDHQLWQQYYDWLAGNADAAWKVRSAGSLAWQNWNSPTPQTTLDAWGCSSAVVALQVIPSKRPTEK